MSKEDRILPLAQKPYLPTVIESLLSLSPQGLSAAIHELERTQTSFSTVRIRKVTGLSVGEARSVRRGILELVVLIASHKDELRQLGTEIIDLGNRRPVVNRLIKALGNVSEKAIVSCDILLKIDNYGLDMPHMETISGEVHHAMYDYKEGIMFPVVQLSISAHSEDQTHEVNFSLDANDFLSVVDDLVGLLKLVREESETVKKKMGSDFVGLIDHDKISEE